MKNLERVLLTGFEPFWGYARNVSQMVVTEIASQGDYPFKVEAQVLPTSFKRAPELMAQALECVQPQVAISFGLLENISALRLERIGLNINHTLQEDIDGERPEYRHILNDGPLAYEVSLPFSLLIDRLHNASMPVEVSYHAETFVCNHLIYTTMHRITTEKLPVLYGFVHLPRLPEDVRFLPLGTSCMTLPSVIAGIDLILKTLPLI